MVRFISQVILNLMVSTSGLDGSVSVMIASGLRSSFCSAQPDPALRRLSFSSLIALSEHFANQFDTLLL